MGQTLNTVDPYFNALKTGVVEIQSGESLSSPIWIGNWALTAIRMPSSWTAAPITFQAATYIDQNIPIGFGPDSDWLDIHDAQGDESACFVGPAMHVALWHIGLRGNLYIRIRSGFAASPVAQGDLRKITLVFGGVS
jgi:hypothetical protein